MNQKDLEVSISEAHRFLSKAQALESLFKKYPDQTWYHAPKYAVVSAACKRASMDLTRALAEIRKYK